MICGKDRFSAGSEREGVTDDERGCGREELEMMEEEGESEKSRDGIRLSE